jgi:hypothetical protein
MVGGGGVWSGSIASAVNAFTYVQGDSGTAATATTATDTLTLTSANSILGILTSSSTNRATFTINQGNIDHGSIGGLGDDDHTQYHTDARATTWLATKSASGLSNGTTGSGSIVLASSPTLTTPNIGTPSAGTLTNCTGLPISTGVSGLGTGVATFLATPSSANLASALTDESGSTTVAFTASPTFTGTPIVPDTAETVYTTQAVNAKSSLDAVYGADAANIIRYMKTLGTFYPSTAKAVSRGVSMLQYNAIWQRLDAFYFFGGLIRAQGLVNWLQPGTYDATEVGSPGWTAVDGHSGDATGAYLNTNFNPNTASSPRYTLNAASVGGYFPTIGATTNRRIIGTVTGSSMFVLPTGTNLSTRLNDGTTNNIADTSTNGLFAINRTASTSYNKYAGGVNLGAAAVTATAVPGANISFLAGNGVFSDATISMGWIGQNLTGSQVLALDFIAQAIQQEFIEADA